MEIFSWIGSQMFKRTAAVWSSLLVCCVVLVYFQFIAVREKDLAAYQDLMQESLDIKSKHALEKEPGKQIRSHVQKDIWTGENQKKSHIRIVSESSELIISQQGRSLQAYETFRNMMRVQVPMTLRCRSMYVVPKEGSMAVWSGFVVGPVRLSMLKRAKNWSFALKALSRRREN